MKFWRISCIRGTDRYILNEYKGKNGGSMGYFPFFIDIQDKKGLVVGGGRIAAHKVEKLRTFGAKLTVIAPVIQRELTQDQSLVCLERSFTDSDILEHFFVIAATDNRKLNAHIGQICREKGIPVNVVDDREGCDFLFPALVKEGKLTVGISTEGASPQVAASIRSQVAQELPSRMEAILDYLESIREPAKRRIRDREQRASFLKEAASFCMEQNRPLTEEETEEWLKAYDSRMHYFILSLMEEQPVLNSFHIEKGNVTKEDLEIV